MLRVYQELSIQGADVNDSVRKIRMAPGKKTLIQRLLIVVSITAKHAPEPSWVGSLIKIQILTSGDSHL